MHTPPRGKPRRFYGALWHDRLQQSGGFGCLLEPLVLVLCGKRGRGDLRFQCASTAWTRPATTPCRFLQFPHRFDATGHLISNGGFSDCTFATIDGMCAQQQKHQQQHPFCRWVPLTPCICICICMSTALNEPTPRSFRRRWSVDGMARTQAPPPAPPPDVLPSEAVISTEATGKFSRLQALSAPNASTFASNVGQPTKGHT